MLNDQHDILVKGHDVELYVQDESEPHHSTGVYSLLSNKWIEKPRKITVEVDIDEVKRKAHLMMRRIDHVLHAPNRRRLIDKMKEFSVKDQ